MTEYSYHARDRSGKSIAGVFSADSPESVAQKLKQQGYLPITIDERRTVSFNWRSWNWFITRRIHRSDLNLMTRQLATLQKAGLPLLVSLNAASEEVESPALQRILRKVTQDVEAGDSLSSALAKHPTVFNGAYVEMVRAGEIGGILDDLLYRLALLGEHDEETAMRIRTATQYPMLVLCVIFLAFIFLTTFVVPKFSSLFSRFGATLPLPTQLLLALSLVIQRYWIWCLIGTGMILFIAKSLLKTSWGRELWDRFTLRIPVFGALFSKIYFSYFARVVGMLSQAGIPIVDALNVATGVVQNYPLQRAIRGVAQGVTEGKGLSEPMRISKVFPPMLVHMVRIGEESGKVDELLLLASEHYDAQSSYMIQHLGTLIEPLLLCILGGMVLFVALGIFLPMWNLISLFRH